jgi:type III secretion protein Q
VGDLAALKPGYVFELAARLEDAPVVIRANGVAVGRGELVAVGDTLGVQLLSLDQNGPR